MVLRYEGHKAPSIGDQWHYNLVGQTEGKVPSTRKLVYGLNVQSSLSIYIKPQPAQLQV